MKNIKELGLELIELEDQVLLVQSDWKDIPYIKNAKDDKVYMIAKEKIALEILSVPVKNCPQIIASTKQLEGLPLLVIEDEVEKLAINSFGHKPDKEDNYILLLLGKGYIVGFKQGYNKAKEKFKFTEEDMIEFLEWAEKEHWWKSTDARFPLTVGLWTKTVNGDFKYKDGKLTKELLQLWKEQRTNKELWVDVIDIGRTHYIKDDNNGFNDVTGINFHKYEWELKISEGKIKAIWK